MSSFISVKIHARFHSNATGPTNCTVQTGLCIKIANFSRCECSEEVPLSGKRLLLLGTKQCQAKRKKKSRTSSNYKPANVLRCVYDRIYVKLSHSVNKLYGYVLQCLHLFLHWLTSHAQGSQGETRAYT